MSGVIVSVKPGQQPPSALVGAISKHHLDHIVIAAPDEGGVVDLPLPADADIDKSIANVLSMFKDVPCNIYFSTPIKGLKAADTQPYPIIFDSSGEKVLLAAMLEGQFPKFLEEGYTSAFCVVRDLLADSIKELYQENKEDMVATMKAADTPAFRRIINSAMGGQRGAVLLIPAEGSPVLFAKGVMDDDGTGVNGTWGWSTQALGYTEAKPGKETAKEPDKPLSKREQMMAMLNSRKPAEEDLPFVPDKKPVTAPDGAPPKTDTRPVPDNTETLIKCPHDATAKQGAVKQWISRNLVSEWQLVKGWDTGMGYPQKAFKKDAPAISHFKTFAEAAAALNKRQTPDEPVKVVGKYLPIMGPKTKEHMVQLIKDDDEIFATKIQEKEAPYVSFTEELSIDEDVPLFWEPEAYLRLSQQDCFGTTLLMEEMRRRIHKLDPSIESRMKAKLAKAAEPPPVISTAGKSKKELMMEQLNSRKSA